MINLKQQRLGFDIVKQRARLCPSKSAFLTRLERFILKFCTITTLRTQWCQGLLGLGWKCTFCNNKPETRIHLFYSCSHSIQFWTDLKTRVLKNSDHSVKISFKDVIAHFESNLDWFFCSLMQFLEHVEQEKCIYYTIL